MPLSKPTRNFLALFLGTTTVIIGTVLLLAIAMGWQYDFSTGELRETGLILMNSEPSGATITINNDETRNRTPYRYTSVNPGRYEIKYTLDKFRPWIKQVSVAAERVSFADYAWMIPSQVPTRSRYTNISFQTAWQSLDRRRFVLREQSSPTAEPRLYTSTDLARPPVLLYTPSLNPSTPASTNAAAVSTIDNLTYSADGDQILFSQTRTDGSVDWLTMPAAPTSTPKITNLTTTHNIKPTWISWSPSGSNELYFTQDQVMRRITLSDQSISPELIKQVWAAQWSNQTLLTVEGQTDQRELKARVRDQLNNPETISKIAASATYQLAYFKFLSEDYIASLPLDTQTLNISRGIFANKAQRTTSAAGSHITKFTVNRSGRYLVHNQNNRFVSIDFEQNQRYRFNTSLQGLTNWDWINDQHLAVVTGDQLRLIDYDGQNNELIGTHLTGTDSITFGDAKSILAFQQADKTAADTTTQNSLWMHFFLNPDRIIE